MGIRNTTTDAQENPLLTLLTTAQPGGIEAQEAAGQRQLVNSESLPTEGSDDPAWVKFGVIFGEPSAGDPIFRPATLPPGWKKVGTDHSMWSKLVDDKGRERAMIFYKAAFYDRSAHMHLIPRFIVRKVYEPRDRVQAEVVDCGASVFATKAETMAEPDTREEWLARGVAEEKHVAACAAWLNERYPNWKDVTAHWD